MINKLVMNATKHHKPVKRQLFPEKLWDLVNQPASGIQWSPDGKRIEVERTQLEKFIGTKFRSHNFDSFIRQLHFYGFRKCGNSYHHDKFQRGHPEALYSMKRKYSNITASLCNSPSSMGSIYSPISSSNGSMATTTFTKSSLVGPLAVISSSTTRSTPIIIQPPTEQINLIKSHETANEQEETTQTKLNLSIVYSLKADYDTRVELDRPNEFRIVRENVVNLQKNGDCIIIPIPESVKLEVGISSPKMLVIRRTQYGQETILTAHFVYTCLQLL